MWPTLRTIATSIGSLTPLPLPLETTVTYLPLHLQEITASQPAAKKIRRPRARPVSLHGRYGRVGERRGSLGQQPIIILLPGRLEVGLSARQRPIIIRHSRRLAQRPGLAQRPIIIQHSRRLTHQPGLGQRPMIIRRWLEISLEPAGQ